MRTSCAKAPVFPRSMGSTPAKMRCWPARRSAWTSAVTLRAAFTPEEIDVWDVYFTMSKTHAYILMQAGVPAEKIYVPHYIDDPYGGDLNTYRKCRDKICEELQTFEQHLGF